MASGARLELTWAGLEVRGLIQLGEPDAKAQLQPWSWVWYPDARLGRHRRVTGRVAFNEVIRLGVLQESGFEELGSGGGN